jgi:hypothetical protein
MSLTFAASLSEMPKNQILPTMIRQDSHRVIPVASASLVSALFGLSISLVAGDTKLGDAAKLPPASDKKGLTYAADIQPIFEKSCVKCHSGEKPKAKYRIDTLASAIKGGESGDPAIVPGNSAKSPMVHYISDLVEDMEMPPTDKRDKFPPLTKQQIGLIRAWIDQGAK